MKSFLRYNIPGYAAGFLSFLLPFIICGIEKDNSDMQAFPLQEISVFDNRVPAEFRRGRWVECTDKPEPGVKALPAFKSDKPVYGSVCFDKKYGVDNIGINYCFALDEQEGTGSDYDLLYFDLNHDFDLTNDPPIKPISDPPPGMSFVNDYNRKEMIFDYIRLEFVLESGKKTTLELLPHFVIRNDVAKTVYFISSKLRTGEVDIMGKKYMVYLGFDASIGTAYNYPGTALHLIPRDNKQTIPNWWGSHKLKAIQNFGGTRSDGYYRFSTTPEGDRLFVKPYTGDFGTFEIGDGGRKIDKIEASGALASQDVVVAVGGELDDSGYSKPARMCTIPIGDYSPSLLRLNYGRLQFDLSENYHSDGKLMKRDGNPFLESIKIQKDKPFVLDFSNQPEVMFVSPPKNHKVKAGDNLFVESVLVEPVMDIMIRRLYDTTRKIIQEDNQEFDLSLDPEATITRSNGEIVARCNMPFNTKGTCRYIWDVPEDLKINGKEEPFTINITYDTLELYGQVKGSREVVVYKE